jgi:ATP-dependent helicase/nuclease subunit A
VLVHPTLGLGPRRVDLERRIQYPTLARLALQEKLRRENLAEEQRILYVAMTRPQEKLILVDAVYHAGTRLKKLCAVAGCPALPEAVAEGRSMGDWILLPLLCRPEAAPCGPWRNWSGETLRGGGRPGRSLSRRRRLRRPSRQSGGGGGGAGKSSLL